MPQPPPPPTPLRPPGAPGPTDWSRVPAPGGPRAGLGVGAVVALTFRTWWRDLFAYAVLAVAAAAPIAWVTYRLYRDTPELLNPTPTADPRALVAGFYGRYGGLWFVGIVLLAIELGAVLHGVSRRLEGARPGLGEMLSVGLQRSFAVFALILVIVLALFGTACTVAGPFLLAAGWAVSAPAVVVERAGPIRALGRSWELTAGRRWAVVGAVLLVCCVVWAVVLPLEIAFTQRAVGWTGSGSPTDDQLRALALPVAILQVVGSVIGTPVVVATGVIHHRLRLLREGGDPAHLGRVFD